MWNNEALSGLNSGPGGGYFKESPPGSATAKVVDKKVFKAQNVVPFTIRQLVDCKEGGLKFGKTDVHMVTTIGRLLEKQVKSTSESYTLEDDTGRIEAVIFISNDEGTVGSPDHQLNEYYRVFGSVTSHANQNRLMMYNMRPITSLNDMTTHLLEVIQTSKLSAESEYPDQGMSVSDPMGPFNTTGGQFAATQSRSLNPAKARGEAIISNLTNQQQLIFKTINQHAGPQGLDKASIPAMLNNRITAKELDVILEFLSGEGHIYTTVDDSTFRATDL